MMRRSGLKLMPIRQMLPLFICLLLMLSLLLSWPTGRAQAAESSRVAKITELKGDVFIKKSGGSKEYRAFKSMTLNRTDHLITKSKASVVLKVLDSEDEITLGANTELYISELTGSGDGKKARFSVWAGSIWVKAKSLFGKDDEFEIETPTAVMGVRGTHFAVVVHPRTGDANVTASSGIVRAAIMSSLKKNDNNAVYLIYPSQEINLFREPAMPNLRVTVSVVDIEELVTRVDPVIIEKMIRNKSDIDKENRETIERNRSLLEQGIESDLLKVMNIRSVEDLARVEQNLQALVDVVVNKAVEVKRIKPEEVEKIVQEVNQISETPITINKEINTLQLTEEDLTKQQEAKKVKQEITKEREVIEAELEEESSAYAELLEQISVVIQEKVKANLEAVEKLKKKVVQQYIETLSSEEASVFEESKELLEEEASSDDDTDTGTSTGDTTGGTTGSTPTDNTGGSNPGDNTGDSGDSGDDGNTNQPPAEPMNNVTLNSIADRQPGDQVTLSGTAAYDRIVLKVLRPDSSLFDLDSVVVTNGAYTYIFALPSDAAAGTYTVVVGNGADVATVTFTVTN